MTRVELLELPLDALGASPTLDQIEVFGDSGMPHQNVAVNAAKIVQARSKPDLAEIIRSCDLLNPDGMAAIRAGKLLVARCRDGPPGSTSWTRTSVP